MFTKLKNIKSYSPDIISIDQLVQLVRYNPNKDKIEYLRSIEYKSNEYTDIKSKLPAIIASGIFSDISKSGLVTLNKYLYYDIDGLDTIKEVDDTIKKLNDTLPISFICKSCGGRGISFFVKVIDINSKNRDNIYKYIFMLIEKIVNIKLDKSAGGLARKVYISSDEKCIYNSEVSFDYNLVSSTYNMVSFQTWLDDQMNQLVVGINKKGSESIGLDDTFSAEIIPYDELLNSIKLEIPYTKEIVGNFIIDEVDSYSIFMPKIIKDGDKHRIYTRIINALCYINKEITFTQVYSYIYHMNKKQIPKMDTPYLLKFTNRIYNLVISNGPIIKTRKKKIHFNKDTKLNGKEKQIMAAKINNTIRTNLTIEKIHNAIDELIDSGIPPTQKNVCILINKTSKISIATVKRNWTKDRTDINEIRYEKNIPNEIEPLFDITEDDFFNEKEEINYKGIRKVLIDKITKDDKKHFIQIINELVSSGKEPSEGILNEMNIFQEEKTWYLYDKWRNNNPYK